MLSAKLIILLETIKKLLRRNALLNITKIISKLHPADVAHLIAHLTPKERKAVFSILSQLDEAPRIISELDSTMMIELLHELDSSEIARIIQGMPADDAADLIGHLPEQLAEQVLEHMAEKDSKEVEQLLSYRTDTAGGIMTTDFFALHEDVPAKEAVEQLHQAKDIEMVFYLYVIDDAGHLVGVLSLRQLILAKPDTKLRDIMTRDVVSVRTDRDQEEVAHLVAKYDLLAIPVVDDENHLTGIITVDDVVDVMAEEATEDFYKMAGTDDEEIVLGNRIGKIISMRLPWLALTLVGELFSGFMLWKFKLTLEQFIALAAFVPLIMALGGNIGGQSATILVRGLATGKIRDADAWKVLFREIRIAASMGLICGLAVGLLAYLWQGNPVLGLVVAAAMFAAATVSSCIGTLHPIFFRKLGIDPAVSSSPFVSTSNDIAGIVIYLGLATLLFKLM